MCLVIWLVKQLFIKLGWLKATDSTASCGLVVANRGKTQSSSIITMLEVKE